MHFFRLKWEVIKAMQLFLEHILLKNPDVPAAYLYRLQLVNLYTLTSYIII